MNKLLKINIFSLLLILTIVLTSCDIKINFDALLGNKCNHSYEEIFVPATCEEQGYTIHKCSNCNDEFIDDYTSALGHSYDEGVIKKESTCLEQGVKEFKCLNCSNIKEELLPLNNHKIIFEDGKKPTCSSLGSIGRSYCEVCLIEFTGEEILDYVDHTFVDEIIKETCKSEGYTKHTCTVCEHVVIDNYVEKLPHEFVDGKCSSCGLSDNSTYKNTYGYEQLANETNGDKLQLLYEDISQMCLEIHNSKLDYNKDTDFKIGLTKYGLTPEEGIHVWQVFRADNPYYYWLDTSLLTTNSYINIVISEESYLYSDRVKQMTLIDNKINEYLSYVNLNDTKYNIALTLHDLIVNSIDYAYDPNGNPELSSWAHSILGVFDNRGAVCEGYTKAYQLLLTACGIENIFVTGAADNVNHAWNLVKLDDENWYWCDITWNDKPQWQWGIDYSYFMKNDTENVNNPGYSYITQAQTFLTKHLPNYDANGKEDKLYDLPARSLTTYNSTDVLFSKFEIDKISYSIIGYDKVIVDYIDKSGDVTIPKSIVYKDKEYIVFAIGKVNDGAIDATSVLSNSVTKLTIPSSVSFIADDAFDSIYLTFIEVEESNQSYASLSGVLYTKDYYTLIKYPSNLLGDSFEIPKEVNHIAYRAFTSLNNLYTLKIGDNVSTVGVYNMGYNYHTSNSNYSVLSYFEAEFASIFSNLKSEFFKSRNITISDKNTNFVISNNVIYSYNYEILYFILSNESYVVISDKVKVINRYATLYSTKLSTIYYFGNSECWSRIDIHKDNDIINSVSIYYYSEIQPENTGNYWYLSGNTIKKW